MIGIDPVQLRTLVIRPALDAIGLGGDAAEEQMLGIVLQESSGGRYLHQLGAGPAEGIDQLEPATANDIDTNYLGFRPALRAKVMEWVLPGLSVVDQLPGNQGGPRQAGQHAVHLPALRRDHGQGKAAPTAVWFFGQLLDRVQGCPDSPDLHPTAPVRLSS